MTNTFSFEFEELPLVIVDGIEAALINGCAEIEYSRSGDWAVQSVAVEGHQKLTPEERARGMRPWIYVRTPHDLADTITGRLEGQWAHKVQDAINNQLAEDRICAADDAADRRRDERMMEL